jgi:hypothetical protein
LDVALKYSQTIKPKRHSLSNKYSTGSVLKIGKLKLHQGLSIDPSAEGIRGNFSINNC